jgi:hypothetical protein
MPASIDITGQKYNMLTALYKTGRQTKNKQYFWLCKCDCGNTKEVRIGSIRTGRTKSCGCLSLRAGSNSPNYKHGRSQTKEYDLELHMKRAYGLDFKDYERMLEAQNGVCAICSSPPPNNRKTRLAIDHCHKTGKVRGLLCDKCNRSIGLLKDDVSVLKSAIKYLNKGK